MTASPSTPARIARPSRTKVLALAAAVAMVLGLMGVVPPASAATIWYVDSSADGDACTVDAPCATITEAVAVAAAGDTITIAPSAEPYAGDIDVVVPLTIEGAAGVVIAAGVREGANVYLGAEATLKDLSIQTNDGVAIGVDGVAVTLDGVSITGEGLQEVFSVGIGLVGGEVDATDVSIRDTGSAIIADGGTVRLRDSTLTDNGAALHAEGAAAEFTGVTVTGGNSGLTVALDGASLALSDSHIEGVGADTESGVSAAILVGRSANVTVTRTTLVGNRMGVLTSGGELTLTDSRIDGAIDPSQPAD